MTLTTRMARITGPVAYRASSGKQLNIPLGPCLVEQGQGGRGCIVWGAKGQKSAAFPMQDIERAEDAGHLVLFDQDQGNRARR